LFKSESRRIVERRDAAMEWWKKKWNGGRVEGWNSGMME